MICHRCFTRNKIGFGSLHLFAIFETLLSLFFELFSLARDFVDLLLPLHSLEVFDRFHICTGRFDCDRCMCCRGISPAAANLNSSLSSTNIFLKMKSLLGEATAVQIDRNCNFFIS